ncbi:hypothetical protein CYLTODRAFT_493143 [Cylindrobasidium torrendii FP15055 ss-10]|uniref:Uncharacterized protein n=1 Tax=Cylindrobasidium torrendii FP15055 ss-10 TaxID=1314674 RepID=A0A0D7B1Q0_9AGAR|nr:hypothetical protein CYLTODRAFT_493143 [Cylindrobasidium torrendii FP15055 ss-10]
MLYRLENLSLTRNFLDPVPARLFEDVSPMHVGYFECFGGLCKGEFKRYLSSEMNFISIQPSIQKAVRTNRIGFVPADEALKDIVRLYEHNTHCKVPDRKRFAMVINISAMPYTAI